MIKVENVKPGNTVRVWQKIKEGGKTRLQAFEGLVIAHKHGEEPGATFTVRKIAEGIGVERIFPLFSPNIDKVELVKRSSARRAKLYYVREKAAREIGKKMKQVKKAAEGEPSPRSEAGRQGREAQMAKKEEIESEEK